MPEADEKSERAFQKVNSPLFDPVGAGAGAGEAEKPINLLLRGRFLVRRCEFRQPNTRNWQRFGIKDPYILYYNPNMD